MNQDGISSRVDSCLVAIWDQPLRLLSNHLRDLHKQGQVALISSHPMARFRTPVGG